MKKEECASCAKPFEEKEGVRIETVFVEGEYRYHMKCWNKIFRKRCDVKNEESRKIKKTAKEAAIANAVRLLQMEGYEVTSPIG